MRQCTWLPIIGAGKIGRCALFESEDSWKFGTDRTIQMKPKSFAKRKSNVKLNRGEDDVQTWRFFSLEGWHCPKLIATLPYRSAINLRFDASMLPSKCLLLPSNIGYLPRLRWPGSNDKSIQSSVWSVTSHRPSQGQISLSVRTSNLLRGAYFPWPGMKFMFF